VEAKKEIKETPKTFSGSRELTGMCPLQNPDVQGYQAG
jgi:hypothetical protein